MGEKPCPFCKSTDLKFVEVKGPEGYTLGGIQCMGCGVCVHWIFEFENVEAMCWKLWNRRGLFGKLMSILRFDQYSKHGQKMRSQS